MSFGTSLRMIGLNTTGLKHAQSKGTLQSREARKSYSNPVAGPCGHNPVRALWQGVPLANPSAGDPLQVQNPERSVGCWRELRTQGRLKASPAWKHEMSSPPPLSSAAAVLLARWLGSATRNRKCEGAESSGLECQARGNLAHRSPLLPTSARAPERAAFRWVA